MAGHSHQGGNKLAVDAFKLAGCQVVIDVFDPRPGNSGHDQDVDFFPGIGEFRTCGNSGIIEAFWTMAKIVEVVHSVDFVQKVFVSHSPVFSRIIDTEIIWIQTRLLTS